VILDPNKAKVKSKAENVDMCYPHVFQSRGEFDLRSGVVSNDDNLYYEATGVIVCVIGLWYNNCFSSVAIHTQSRLEFVGNSNYSRHA